MVLIVCTDTSGGMSFNNRRLSRDEEVIKRIKNLAPKLYINAYSKDLFPEATEGLGDVYFAELDLPDCVPDEIYLFNWNRLYPKDLTFTIDLNNYKLLSTEDFRGSSHEKITLSHYRRK
ncbi:MAG: ribonuclease Z [Clostridia bacterium]|nr:ribonuclease Z [Clostridia bacterium]